jgi:hypothetical protein
MWTPGQQTTGAQTGTAPTAGGWGAVPWEQGLGALGSIFGGMGGRDPYAAAESKMGEIPGMLKGYFDPYLQAGKWALPRLYTQYGQLLTDPGARMAQMGAGFQQSPGYEFQRQQALDAANRAAAAGGMVGTPEEQQQIAQTTGQLANQDYYNYLNHVLGLYQAGLGGTMGLGQMGERAATGLGEDIASVMAAQAQLEAARAAGGQQRGAGLGGALGGMLGGGISGAMGGGGLAGALGGALGGLL